MTFNGNNLVLAIGDGTVTTPAPLKFAHAQTASISFSDAMFETTTKDSDSWSESKSGRHSFTISTDGLADFDDVANAQATEQFSDLAIAGTLVAFTYQRPGTGLTSGDLEGWSGEAYIESFDISSTSDEAVTYSVSLKGTGKPTKVTAT